MHANVQLRDFKCCAICGGRFGLVRYYSCQNAICSKRCAGDSGIAAKAIASGCCSSRQPASRAPGSRNSEYTKVCLPSTYEVAGRTSIVLRKTHRTFRLGLSVYQSEALQRR